MRTQYDGNAIKESILKDSNIISPTWRDDFEIYRKEVKNQQINIMELILVNKKELQEMLDEIRPSDKQPEPIKEENKYLSPLEAIEYMRGKGINIAKSTLYKLTMNKKIPFVHFGEKRILFRAEELNAWIESRLKRGSDANPVTIAVAKDARSKKL